MALAALAYLVYTKGSLVQKRLSMKERGSTSVAEWLHRIGTPSGLDQKELHDALARGRPTPPGAIELLAPSKSWRVASFGLNLRDGRSTSHRVICVLKQGDTVVVMEKKTGWWLVEAECVRDGVSVISQGWVGEKYLTM